VSDDFKRPKRTPSRHSHLERLLGDYSKAHGVAPDRMRRWISTITLIGALDRVRDGEESRFLVKGGVSMELRLGLGARSTQDVDFVFRGRTTELLDALQEAFKQPYSGFEFRRKGEPEEIRDTGSKRLELAVSFQQRGWQTIRVEIGRPEADESDLVSSAISLADFKLDSPQVVACMSLRYQIAQKIHAVTEEPADGRPNLRYWDLIDLILLRALLEDDLWRVREACVQTFAVRATHDWPPTLRVPEAWSEPYRFDVSQMEADLPADVQVAAEAVVEFIGAIDVAVRGEGRVS
jgi:Nucleotidyl transferase AbiEii toxin, Type IV TA system